MKKTLSLIALGAAALVANAQQEAVWISAETITALGLEERTLNDAGKEVYATTLPAQTLLCEGTAASLLNAYEDVAGDQSIECDGVKKVAVDGVEYSLVKGVGGNTNPAGVSITTPPTGGWVFQFNVNEDGYITVFSKLSSNKAYYVWEGNADSGILESYTLRMVFQGEVKEYTLPADEMGYFDASAPDADVYTDGVNLRWPEKIWLGVDADDVKKNGFGCVTFPVYADAGTYLFHAQGSKVITNGFIFTKEAPTQIVAGAPQEDGTWKQFVYVGSEFDFSSGIESVVVDADNENAPVYNVMGQRVSKDTKGLLIQNGKKFYNF